MSQINWSVNVFYDASLWEQYIVLATGGGDQYIWLPAGGGIASRTANFDNVPDFGGLLYGDSHGYSRYIIPDSPNQDLVIIQNNSLLELHLELSPFAYKWLFGGIVVPSTTPQIKNLDIVWGGAYGPG